MFQKHLTWSRHRGSKNLFPWQNITYDVEEEYSGPKYTGWQRVMLLCLCTLTLTLETGKLRALAQLS